MARTLVALMQPSAGGHRIPHKGAAKAFYRASLKGVDRIELEQSTSMLPRCFNMMLCDALNLREEFPHLSHLAMLHDDVAPEPGWLDVLLDELDASGADLLSVAVPIKDGAGLTSTARDDPADPYAVRRLTLSEVFRMPETFAAADCPWPDPGGPLLANTGCWVARLGPWADAFIDPANSPEGQSGFRFLNRIVRGPDGKLGAQDIAEDWHFSRFLAGQGLKVMATRKIPVVHEQDCWHNHAPWGTWPTDLAWLALRQARRTASDVPGWRFPGDVEGWLSETEGRALARLAQDKAVLEIGSYCGRSTVCMAQTAVAVCAVDPFDGRATDRPGDTLAAFLENLARYGVLGKVTTLQGVAREALPGIEERFDLAFIDGAHDRQSVLADARLARARLNPGGLLAFHDYRVCPGEHDGNWDPGVTEAVGEMLAKGGCELLERAGTVAVLRPPAAA